MGQFYEGKLYRDDLLPVPSYLYRCARAHAAAGEDALANLWEESFLGDGQTRLGDYVRRELWEARERPEEARASGWNLTTQQAADLHGWLQGQER